MKRFLLLFVVACLAFLSSRAQTFYPQIIASKSIGCPPLDVSFDVKTASPYPVSQWIWDFGDGATDTVPQPIHTYTQRGRHEVKLTVVLQSGFSATTTFYPGIDVLPVLDLGPTRQVLCKGQCLSLSNVGLAGAEDYPAHYQWWEGGDTSRFHNVCQAGWYHVNYSACSQTLVDSVYAVAPVSTTGLGLSYTGCSNEINATITPAFNAVDYQLYLSWGDGTYVNYTDDVRHFISYSHTYAKSGEYNVEMYMQYLNSCTDTIVSHMSIHALDTPQVHLGADTVIASGQPITLNTGYPEDKYFYLATEWSTGDSTQTIQVTQPGTYWVKVLSTCNGAVSRDTIVISQLDTTAIPTAVFTADKQQCTTVRFTDQSTTAAGTSISSRYWSFGDNTADTAQNPLHTYSQRGEYTVSLVVVNSVGKRDTATTTLYFAPLLVNLGADTTLAAGDSLLLDARKPNNSGDAYLWSTGSTQPVIVVYTSGSYWVKVTSCGTTVTDTIAVTIPGVPPANGELQAGFGFLQTGCRTYQFMDTSKITAGNISRWVWQFGDNTTDTLPNPVHTYSQPGNYIVTLIVADNSGKQDTAIKHIINNAIAVNLGRDIDTLRPGGSIRLSAPYPAGSHYSFHWSTGDTTAAITITQPGTYALRVSDWWCGTSAADTINISFANPAGIKAAIGIQGRNCTSVHFLDESTALQPIVKWEWSFGDGTTDTTQSPVHTYSQRGEYTVSLLIVNSAGQRDTAFTTIYFAPVLVNLGADTTLAAGDSLLLDARKPNNSGDNYLWSTGATTPTITVRQAGTYWVKVTTCNTVVSDTIRIVAATTPENPASVGNTTTVNANDSLAITASFDHSFNSNNIFTIQLLQGSNTGGKKAGELDGAVTDLATIPGTDPRIAVKVSMPDTIPCGQDYRVRILSSSPADTTDWSSKFAVVNAPVATLQQRGDSLFAGKALTYQWYFNGAALTGATTAAIRAKANGQYYVIVSNGGTCRSTSATVNMVITAVPDVTVGENIVRAFPNPTAGLVYVRFEKPLLKPVDLIVHDTKGNTLYRRQIKDQLTEIDLGTLPKGIYYLEVAGYGKQKAMRIILQ